jgi:hypothetical protein
MPAVPLASTLTPPNVSSKLSQGLLDDEQPDINSATSPTPTIPTADTPPRANPTFRHTALICIMLSLLCGEKLQSFRDNEV